MNPALYQALSPKLYDYIQGEKHALLKNELAQSQKTSLPQSCYTDEDNYQYDLNNIILNSWQFVGHISEFNGPGSFVRLNIGNFSVVAVMRPNGGIKAFENVCPHRASPLVLSAKGKFNRLVQCPFHGWSFDFDGVLANIPHWKDDYPHVEKESCTLTRFETDVFHGLVFVKLGDNDLAPSKALDMFSELIGHYRLADMVPAYEPEDTFYEANWKLIMENDRNADHIPLIHPEYNGLFGYRGFTEVLLPQGVWHAALPMKDRTSHLWSTRSYQKILPDMPHLPEALKRTWTNFSTYPNFAFFMHPEAVDVIQVLPINANQSVVRSYGYILKDDRREIEIARYLAGRIDAKVFEQDKAMLESVQIALQAGRFSDGPVSATELGVLDYNRCFQNIYPEHFLRDETLLRMVAE